MGDSLAAPYKSGNRLASTLYLARGEEVYVGRPILTGDIFSEVSIDPQPKSATKMVMVMQHPCSMRSDGVKIRSKLLVAQLEKGREWEESDWQRYFPKMALPLLGPELKEGKNWVVNFDKLHVVPSSSLHKRIACLSSEGINILLQRWVHYSSRVIVSTDCFQEATEPFLEETELVEEWCEYFEAETAEAALYHSAACMDWLREELDSGLTRQLMLKNPQQRSTVRREMKTYLKNKKQ